MNVNRETETYDTTPLCEDVILSIMPFQELTHVELVVVVSNIGLVQHKRIVFVDLRAKTIVVQIPTRMIAKTSFSYLFIRGGGFEQNAIIDLVRHFPRFRSIGSCGFVVGNAAFGALKLIDRLLERALLGRAFGSSFLGWRTFVFFFFFPIFFLNFTIYTSQENQTKKISSTLIIFTSLCIQLT